MRMVRDPIRWWGSSRAGGGPQSKIPDLSGLYHPRVIEVTRRVLRSAKTAMAVEEIADRG